VGEEVFGKRAKRGVVDVVGEAGRADCVTDLVGQRDQVGVDVEFDITVDQRPS
jgi:hypothetical protein